MWFLPLLPTLFVLRFIRQSLRWRIDPCMKLCQLRCGNVLRCNLPYKEGMNLLPHAFVATNASELVKDASPVAESR